VSDSITLLRVTNGSDHTALNTTISEWIWKEAVVSLNEYGRSSDGYLNAGQNTSTLRPSVQQPSVTRRKRAVTDRVYLPRAQLLRDNTGIDLCFIRLSVIGQ
jgi:hypothetical protein